MNFQNVEFLISAANPKDFPKTRLPEIAFAGRSNVGKSSLLNKLLNRKNLARVSSVPGKTATINFYKGENVRFVDLPGYGYAKVARDEKKRWGQLMEDYFRSGRDIRLVVQLTDMRHPVTADDLSMMEFLKYHEIPFAVVMTKSDKLNKTQYKERLSGIEEELKDFGDVVKIPFSALNGEGVQALKEEIERYL